MKTGLDAKKIEVKDERLLGCPQVVVYFQDDLSEQIIVSHQSNWEVISQDKPYSLHGGDSAALRSVVQALETQLKNVHGNLIAMEKQILLRQSIVNRSLTALSESIICKDNKMQAVGILILVDYKLSLKNTFFYSLLTPQNSIKKTFQKILHLNY